MAYYKFQTSCLFRIPMGLTVGFSLHQFSEVFKIRDAAGKPYLIIGGQAVNYWAGRYLSTEPELASLQPFTSQDIDFKGGTDDVRRIAEQLKLPPSYPPKVSMTALAGTIPFQIGDLKSNIEIVRTIPGIPRSVPADALAFEVQFDRKIVWVLNPISLLVSKLELVATVPQKDRRDVLHLKMLIPCIRAYLNEFLQEVENGNMVVRKWLDSANRVLQLTTRARARRLA
jgi:hypothetical protein